MSYRNTVKKNVNLAFKLIKDLGTDALFTKSSTSEFDFATASPTTTVEETKIVRAVLVKTGKSKEDASSLVGELLLKSEDLEDPSVYDSIIIDDKTWNIVEYEDDGYVITAKISKER